MLVFAQLLDLVSFVSFSALNNFSFYQSLLMKMLIQIISSSWSTSLCLLVLFMAGCQSYQLGDPAQLDFKSIYIKPVTNDSFAPQVQALLSSQIRELFIRDSRTQMVNDHKEADVILFVNLISYNRDKMSPFRLDFFF